MNQDVLIFGYVLFGAGFALGALAGRSFLKKNLAKDTVSKTDAIKLKVSLVAIYGMLYPNGDDGLSTAKQIARKAVESFNAKYPDMD